MSKDKEFPQGFFYNEPRNNAPDFVKGGASIKRKEFAEWLLAQDGEWVNLDFKISQSNKPYAEVNTFTPKAQSDVKPPVNEPQKQPVDLGDDSMDDYYPFLLLPPVLIPLSYIALNFI